MPAAPRNTRLAAGADPSGRIAWAGILVLTGAAGLLGLGIFSLFQAAKSAEETARVEAGRAASVTARALAAALYSARVLEILPSEVRFNVADDRILVPADVGWIDAPFESPLPDALPAAARKVVLEARRAEFRENERPRALELLSGLSRGDTLSSMCRAWVLLSAANCAQRAGDTASRDALLDAFLDVLMARGEEATNEHPRDDVLCGAVILCVRSGRTVPKWVEPLFSRVRPDLGRIALERAAAVSNGSAADHARTAAMLERLGDHLAEVAARRDRLRRARDLLPSLRRSQSEVRAAGADVLFFFRETATAGEGALVDAGSLVQIIDRERARSPGLLAAVDTAGTLVHGPEMARGPSVFPVVPPLVGIAPVEPAPGGAGSQWPLIASVGALAVFLFLGIAMALRAVRKERLHTRARAEFLTAVTHELKTPLASIRLLVDILSDRRADRRKSSRYLERLAGESARLTMLVENVLDLGRIERNERSYDRRDADLAEIVGEAIALYRPLAARDGMTIHLESERTPPVIHVARVDRAAMTQVLLNLFENARRYAGAGGSIDVQLRRADGRLRLLVHDHGPGVPEAERESIFEKFRRGRFAEESGNPGVGLGLFLARSIARDHGGDLRCVEPADGRGATFELALPLEESSLEEKESGKRPTGGLSAAQSRETES